jgi:hypothetical protein
MSAMCSVQLFDNYRYRPCSRRASVQRDGVAYCKQHDPEAAKAKKVERDAAWSAKWAAESAASLRKSLILTMCADLTADEVRQAIGAWKLKAEAGA